MPNVAGVVVTEAMYFALTFICSYRYLTVSQVATIAGLKPKSASEMLLKMERQRLLASFGNVGIRGYGKTPKVYYLTRIGHRLLTQETSHRGIEIEPYRQVNITSRWSPLMYHRIATLDIMMALERDCSALRQYRLVKTFVEYRREMVAGRLQRETTDYVRDPPIPENRIVPDAGFVLENTRSERRALFFIEVDCGTERLTTQHPDAINQSFKHKIDQYDWYYYGERFAQRYRPWGDFTAFKLLVITTSVSRIEYMRAALSSDHTAYNHLYRFSTQADVEENFLHGKWLSRDHADHCQHQLIKGDDPP